MASRTETPGWYGAPRRVGLAHRLAYGKISTGMRRRATDASAIARLALWPQCKVCGRSATAIDRRKKMDEWIAKHGPNTRCGNQWVRQRDGQTLTADDFTYKLPKDQR